MAITNEELQSFSQIIGTALAANNEVLKNEITQLIAANNEVLKNEISAETAQLIDAKFKANNKILRRETKRLIRENSNLILGEMDRIEQRSNQRFEKIEQDIQGLRDEVRAIKHSNDAAAQLVKVTTNHERRIKYLEQPA